LVIGNRRNIRAFEGLNHLFQKDKKGIGPEEYWEIEIAIEEEVIENINTWTNAIQVT